VKSFTANQTHPLPEGDLSLTHPFGDTFRVESPRLRIDPLPFVDIALIGLLLAFLQTPLIFQPGYGISLPQSSEVLLEGNLAARVLSLTEEGYFLIDGRIFTAPGSLQSWLVENPPLHPEDNLLVKLPRNYPIEKTLQLAERLRASGFERLIIAAEPRRP
jgi:biopolymer transport protein ExbD